MEEIKLLFSDLGSFAWVFLVAFFYAIAGGAIMGLLDFLARIRKTQAAPWQYWLALGLSFFMGVFIEWRSTLDTIRGLKAANQSLTADVGHAKGEASVLAAKLFEAYKQRDDIALARAALQVTADRLEKDNKYLLGELRDADHQKPYIEIQPPRLRSDNVLVLFWRNTGYARAIISSAKLDVFINGKFYTRKQFITDSLLAIPNMGQSFELEIPAASIQELLGGMAAMNIALEIKYEGLIKDKRTICYEAKYDKPRNMFLNTRHSEIGCDKPRNK